MDFENSLCSVNIHLSQSLVLNLYITTLLKLKFKNIFYNSLQAIVTYMYQLSIELQQEVNLKFTDSLACFNFQKFTFRSDVH